MNTFQKSQAAKMLACYIAPEDLQKSLSEEDDIEKGAAVGYINVGKKKPSIESPENNTEKTVKEQFPVGSTVYHTHNFTGASDPFEGKVTGYTHHEDKKDGLVEVTTPDGKQHQKRWDSIKLREVDSTPDNAKTPIPKAAAGVLGKVIAQALRQSSHGLASEHTKTYDRSTAKETVKTKLSEKSVLGPYEHSFRKTHNGLEYSGSQYYGTYHGEAPETHQPTSTFSSDLGRERVNMKEYKGGISKFLQDYPNIAAGVAGNFYNSLAHAVKNREVAKQSGNWKQRSYYSDIISDMVPKGMSAEETLQALKEITDTGHKHEGKTISGTSLHDIKHQH